MVLSVSLVRLLLLCLDKGRFGGAYGLMVDLTLGALSIGLGTTDSHTSSSTRSAAVLGRHLGVARKGGGTAAGLTLLGGREVLLDDGVVESRVLGACLQNNGWLRRHVESIPEDEHLWIEGVERPGKRYS